MRDAFNETAQLEAEGMKLKRDRDESVEQAGARLVMAKIEEYLVKLEEMEGGHH